MNTNIELSLLDPEEKELLNYIWNLIPEADRQGMTQADVLLVLDLMDDFLVEHGLLEEDEQAGEMTYLDGEIDETEQQLCAMLDELTGSTFDMKGINEFKALLQGE